MNVQDATNLTITEGSVKTIHDSQNRLLWGAVGYNTTYRGDTIQQSYSGKNLFDWPALVENAGDYANATLNEWGANGVTITGNTSTSTIEFASSKGVFRPTASSTNQDYQITVPDNSTITISADVTMLETGYTPRTQIVLDPGGSLGGGIDLTLNQKTRISHTFTNVAAGTYRPVFSLNSCKLKIENIQFELGSTVTDYEPYVGGVPAPNPDYPQTVNVVTGTQTITVTDGNADQTYTVNLGSIELCKIGTYQDYIYKSGGNWYIHKETDSITYDGTESDWSVNTSNKRASIAKPSGWGAGEYIGYSTHLMPGNTGDGNLDNVFNVGSASVFIKATSAGTGTSKTAWGTWLQSNDLTIYYFLATPTDTQITDNTLIGQLNALHEWMTRYGYQSSVSGDLPIIINQVALS